MPVTMNFNPRSGTTPRGRDAPLESPIHKKPQPATPRLARDGDSWQRATQLTPQMARLTTSQKNDSSPQSDRQSSHSPAKARKSPKASSVLEMAGKDETPLMIKAYPHLRNTPSAKGWCWPRVEPWPSSRATPPAHPAPPR